MLFCIVLYHLPFIIYGIIFQTTRFFRFLFLGIFAPGYPGSETSCRGMAETSETGRETMRTMCKAVTVVSLEAVAVASLEAVAVASLEAVAVVMPGSAV